MTYQLTLQVPWKPPGTLIKDKKGLRCGHLLVIKPSPPRPGDLHPLETYWLCLCGGCGKSIRLRNAVLTNSKHGFRSCGCQQHVSGKGKRVAAPQAV